MPTVRNARGSDLIVTDGAESVFHGIQCKALSKRHPVPLGPVLENLRSEWWIVAVHANSAHPLCFVLALDEVRQLAHRSEKDGRVSHWLQPTSYDREDFRDAWHRLGVPVSD